AGADLSGALDSATGVIETLVDNGSSAIGIVQHIADDLGNLGDLADGTPLEMVTGVIDGITGGTDGSPIDLVTGVIDGITGGTDGSPIDLVTGVIDGITGGTDGSPIDLVTGVIDGITGGTDGSPIDLVTGVIDGITGGDLANNPVTGIVQEGIDILQGVESLKTEIINT
ncbi:hypothetical protein, partial [Stutzerimonas stutzeri]|uniref:hypothetical protein n=1 Tax=Stutzerimonas stutzeri TaxID=316 RepID=UPI003AF3E009